MIIRLAPVLYEGIVKELFPDVKARIVKPSENIPPP